MNNILIYGAYGYTGKLIVDLAEKKGYRPVIAGRNEEKIKALANQYQLPYHCFDYDDQNAWDQALAGKKLLVNCAGPFSLTIEQILPACLRNKVHYTDITGEIEVFTYVQKHDQEAKEAGVIMLPGTGFDVVPTDCLAKYLYEKLPTATHLEIAFDSTSGFSRGTALSLLNRFPRGGAYRENGVIKSEPMASVSRVIHYGGKDRLSAGIAWGDVFTAFYTTGIPNIRVYNSMAEKLMKTIRIANKFTWLIGTGLVQKIGRRVIKNKIDGPEESKRESLRSYIWGKVTDAKGNEVEAELETPESYKLTATTVWMCVEWILEGQVKPGYNTPAGALGSDLIMQVEEVNRKSS